MEWFVLYTKSKCEIKVAKSLEEIGVETFCPTITEIRQWSDRKKKIATPLFRSYVFVRHPYKKRNEVLQIPGVVRYLFWLNKPAVVRDEEIKIIKDWLNNESVEDIGTENLSPGDKLTIANGNFKGQEAIVNEIGKKRLRLILKSMNLVVNVKIRDVVRD